MKLHVYGFKNRLTGKFEKPVSEIYESKDYIEFLLQGLSMAQVAELSRYKEYAVYDLGSFDTETGALVSCNDFVCDLEPMILPLINRGESNVGRKEEGTRENA